MVRDAKGHYVKGVSGNPAGRKSRPTEERYLDLLRQTVSISDWTDIIVRAVQDAKRGDGVARKFLADYIVGPPIERKEITGADGRPLLLKWDDGEVLDG